MSTTAQFHEFGPFFRSGALVTAPRIYHYAAGTSTLKNAWTTRAKSATVAQPLVGDSNGIASAYFDGLYKIVVTTADGVQLYSWDNWSAGLNESNVVNLKDAQFGAEGDGTTDDTAAINAWIAHLVANGKVGYAPAGTYRFTSALTGGVGSNWGIEGDGSAAVTFLYAGANTTNDIWTIGDGTTNLINLKLAGFKLKSSTAMTAGIGLHIKRLCRSTVYDVVPDGQDGNGNLWHGIRYNGCDNVFYDNFEARAQKDGVQVNGLAGSNPKAGLMLDHFKIAGCDVGVRCGGAFGGLYFGAGDIIDNGDGVRLDNTLVAEVNREVMFSPLTTIDTCSRCGVVIDQSTSSQFWVSMPAKMWIASTTSHGVWVVNANGAKIAMDAYLYNITGDGVRIDDANAVVSVDNAIFNTVTGYGINPTVVTTNLRFTNARFVSVANPFNETNTKIQCNFAAPIQIQTGRALYWDTYTGTMGGGGTASHAHGKGGTYYTQIIAVFVAVKTAGNAWIPGTINFVDGANIDISGTASRPYQITVLVGQIPNSGW